MRLPSLALAASFTLSLSAQAGEVTFESYTVTHGDQVSICSLIQSEPLTPVGLFAHLKGKPGLGFLVETATTDTFGRAFLMHPIDLASWPADLDIELSAVAMIDGQFPSDGGDVPLKGLAACELLDFDYTIGQSEPQKGEVISEQWGIVGLHVSAINNTGGHPDKAIVFDSAAPTGGDPDLATPGPGVGNDTAHGQLLIIAENDTDADMDGLVDVPDDEAKGGILRFDFDEPFGACSMTVVDVDDAGATEIRFYTDLLSPPDVLTVPNVGDNSVQKLTFAKTGIVRIDLALAGSGGIAEMELVPCPLLVNFDERTLGQPLDLKTGEQITNQFLDLGLTIDANNNIAGNPDKVILFDSENPTPPDPDLITPGYGVDNDTPLGKILIIPTNDIDADMDGLVDVPNDEAGGGQMNFRFQNDVAFVGATILDVDGTRFDEFNLYDAGDNLIATLPILTLGDNSVQTLAADPPIGGVRRAELVLGGSGAVTRLRFCPEPASPPAL